MHKKLTILLVILISSFLILNACDMILTHPDEVFDEKETKTEDDTEQETDIEPEDIEIDQTVTQDTTTTQNTTTNNDTIDNGTQDIFNTTFVTEYETIEVDDLDLARDELYTTVNTMDEDIEEYLLESLELEDQLEATDSDDDLEDLLDEIQLTLNSASDDIEPYYMYITELSSDEEYTQYYYDIMDMRDVLDEYINSTIEIDFTIVEDALVELEADSDEDEVCDYYDECEGYDDSEDEDNDDTPDGCDYDGFTCDDDEECDDSNDYTLDLCEENACAWYDICLEDTDCDDGYDFTDDSCINMSCNNTLQDGYCFDDADCDDLDNSTIDACVSDVCEYYPAHCSNEVLDEDEGDIDCGGSECVICAELSSCNENADCETDYCYTAICEYECDDGDDSGEDITTKSTTTGYLYGTDEYNSYEEICYTDTIVTEYYCQDNRVMEVNYPCSGNETCSNGACS